MDRKQLAARAHDQANRRVYSLYAGYRLLIALILLALHLFGINNLTLGQELPTLYFPVSVGYLVFSLAALSLLRLTAMERHLNTFLMTLIVDVVALVLMSHASGGLSSGVGLLLLITVAAGSMLLSLQLALLLAALGTIGTLIESIAAINLRGTGEQNLFLAGILGILLFATASTFWWVSSRVRSAQLEAEVRARQSRQLQRLNELIVERMHTGILVIDEDDRVQLINSAAISLLGGGTSGTAPMPTQPLTETSPLGQRLEQWRIQPRERPAPFTPYPSASHRIQANFARLHRSDGDQTLIFIEDTRSLAETAQQLKLASLGHLTGSIAHEIRNPLGAISHAAQLLLEGSGVDEASQQRLAGIIKRQSDRVNTIIENILSLSRRRPPRLQRLPLNSWLREFAEEYRESLSFTPILEFDLHSPEPEVIFDPDQLAQVVRNLLDNALRHSFEHAGEYRARLTSTPDRATRLPCLDISDFGAGIRPEDRSRVFDPFFTTSNSGTGLGLYIAKELCEVNYATLTCTPADRGACFRIGFAHPDRLLPRMDSETS